MKIQETILLIVIVKIAKCDSNEASKSKNPLPYFRRKVEGIYEDSSLGTITEDTYSKSLVSFLVKNAKEIFESVTDGDVELTASSLTPDDLPFTKEDTHNVMLYENLSVTTFLDHNIIEPLTANVIHSLSDKGEIENTLNKELMQLTKEMKSYEKSDLNILQETGLTSINSYKLVPTDKINSGDQKRSCIFCDNVKDGNCNDPQNKLIQSVMCTNDGDLCYSQHTPFGIVDRGCFNVNHNLTTYVCSCNLCNYISISDMPLIFSDKLEWVNNVVELSRTRNFRNSVFKDMSCLRCEVNTSAKMGDMLDTANCMEGNIGNLPKHYCEKNEICGIKAVKSDGYIWRGCLTAPRYNYWLALCDTDLCNQDNLVSIYDYLL